MIEISQKKKRLCNEIEKGQQALFQLENDYMRAIEGLEKAIGELMATIEKWCSEVQTAFFSRSFNTWAEKRPFPLTESIPRNATV